MYSVSNSQTNHYVFLKLYKPLQKYYKLINLILLYIKKVLEQLLCFKSLSNLPEISIT